jgi:adenine phosphoribosyltransferase
MEEIATLIRAVPDFPQKGVIFRDITPLLLDAGALRQVVETLAKAFAAEGIDYIAAIESRGFILGAPLAVNLGCGFIPIRKLGKLPGRTISREYALEYGTNHLEMHVDAIRPGDRVLIVDDVLATGGTARAAMDLVTEAGGTTVAIAVLLEISALDGRAALVGCAVKSLLTY